MHVCTLYMRIEKSYIIYCNIAVRDLTDIYAWSRGAQRLRGSVDISVKPQACPCYNIYVTLSIVVCCIAHSWRSITTWQVKYYVVIRCHHISITFQKLSEEKMRWLNTQTKWLCCSDRPAFVHVERLESTSISCLYRGLNIWHIY